MNAQTASNAQKSARALALADMQRRYDLLHHGMRAAWLSSAAPCWGDGSPVLASEALELSRQSKIAIDSDGAHGYRSVDLGDAEYLAELDAFAAAGAA
jgi:hypothetical protein